MQRKNQSAGTLSIEVAYNEGVEMSHFESTVRKAEFRQALDVSSSTFDRWLAESRRAVAEGKKPILPLPIFDRVGKRRRLIWSRGAVSDFLSNRSNGIAHPSIGMEGKMAERYVIPKESILNGCLLTPCDYANVLERFESFIVPFIRHIKPVSRQKKIKDYMKGLMSDVERKNVESIAYYHGADRQQLQKFIGQIEWDDEIILNKLVQHVAREIGTQNGILVLDPTSFPKKGTESVGVQNQWCGRLGKVDNCQVATFLGYVASDEFALIDRRLYLPKEWTDDPPRCRIAGVPEEHIIEKTRHEQSLEMLKNPGK